MYRIQSIIDRNKLPVSSVYLLELLPLIEMIWADGKNQAHEVNILQQFTIKHLANLSEEAEGLEVVSVDEANKFIDHFLSTRPSSQLIADLKSLAVERMRERGDREKNKLVIDYCMDIAAACVSQYPYQASERIREEEKALLRDIIVALQLPERVDV